MRRHPISARSGVGSTYSVHSRRATAARELHSDVDAAWKAVHMRRQPVASIPEGPEEPSVRSAAWRMASPVILSKSTGWNGGTSVAPSSTRASAHASAGDCGCLSLRISSTDLCSPLTPS